MNFTVENSFSVEAIESTDACLDAETPIKYCENCGVTLGRVRRKRFCTTACRVAKHRQNKAQETIGSFQE